jgi:hypothetical protein
MNEPKFTGVWIPRAVFESVQISTTAKLLYGVMAGLDGDDGCYASNGYLASVLGLSERGIQTLLLELEEHDLIQRTEYRGKRVIRTVEGMALGGCRKLRGGTKKTAGGGRRKLHPYNIEDRIEDITTPTPSTPKPEDNIPWAEDENLVPPFSSDAFKKSWMQWVDYRKEIKKQLKPTTVKAQWRELTKWGEANSIASIEQSIRNGWTGLFEPRQNGFQQNSKKPLTAKDHDEF